jgi:hypothetical protein
LGGEGRRKSSKIAKCVRYTTFGSGCECAINPPIDARLPTLNRCQSAVGGIMRSRKLKIMWDDICLRSVAAVTTIESLCLAFPPASCLPGVRGNAVKDFQSTMAVFLVVYAAWNVAPSDRILAPMLAKTPRFTEIAAISRFMEMLNGVG